MTISYQLQTTYLAIMLLFQQLLTDISRTEAVTA